MQMAGPRVRRAGAEPSCPHVRVPTWLRDLGLTPQPCPTPARDGPGSVPTRSAGSRLRLSGWQAPRAGCSGQGRGAPGADLRPRLCSDRAPSPSLSPYSHDEGCLSSSQDHIPLAALPLLATSSPQYQEAVATVIQRANLAYGDFIKSQEGVTFNGQVSHGVREGKADKDPGGGPAWTSGPAVPGASVLPSLPPSKQGWRSAPRPLSLQVCLIGDCVGGILAFDALCYSSQPVSESQSSSRRGSVASVQVPGIKAVGPWPVGGGNRGAQGAGFPHSGVGESWAGSGPATRRDDTEEGQPVSAWQ